MKDFYAQMTDRINAQLSTVKFDGTDIISDARRMILFTKAELEQLRNFALSYEFKEKAEEIDFFRYKKPAIFGQLIFFSRILSIETNCLPMASEGIEAYYSSESEKLKNELYGDMSFYQYYRSGATHYDELYFCRGKLELHIYTDFYFFDTDAAFSTFYDLKVARIVAGEMLYTYLSDKRRLSKELTFIGNERLFPKMNWTGTKAGAIELIYGLYATGCINQGTADISEIAGHFGRMFNVDLGDYYHAYSSMKTRKSGCTAFLENVISKLKEYVRNIEG